MLCRIQKLREAHRIGGLQDCQQRFFKFVDSNQLPRMIKNKYSLGQAAGVDMFMRSVKELRDAFNQVALYPLRLDQIREWETVMDRTNDAMGAYTDMNDELVHIQGQREAKKEKEEKRKVLKYWGVGRAKRGEMVEEDEDENMDVDVDEEIEGQPGPSRT